MRGDCVRIPVAALALSTVWSAAPGPGGCITAAGAAVPPAVTADEWVEAVTPRFVVYSNGGDRLAAGVARKLERFADVIETTTRGLSTDTRRRLPVYAFRDSGSFSFYRRDREGRPESVAGYFMSTPEGGCIALDAGMEEPHRDVLFHEYTHALLDHTLRRAPLWLDEGLAEYFGSSRLGKNWAETGRPIPQHLALLAGRELLELAALLGAVRTPGFHEGDRANLIYAQSWALTHYLMWGAGDDGARFARFLSRMAGGQMPRQAFAAAYEGVPVRALEEGLQAYVRRRSYLVMRREFTTDLEAVPASTRLLARAEVMLRLGELLAARGTGDDAIDHLRGALGTESLRSEAAVLIGLVEEQRGRPAAADSAFAAAALDSRPNARRDLIVGRCLLERALRDAAGVESGETPELLRRARARLESALDADPGNPETLALLGRSYLREAGDVSEGIRKLTEAAVAMPGRSDVIADLVVLHARAGHRSAARRALRQSLEPIADVADLDRARWAIVEADIREFSTLSQGGHSAAADSLLGTTRAEFDHPQMRRRLDEATRVEAIRVYNSAVDAFNRQRLAAALPLFEQARDRTPDPELRRLAGAGAVDCRHFIRIEEALVLARRGERTRANAMLEEVLAADPSDDVRRYAEEVRRALGRGR